ncbi:CO(2)-response secreted protease [Linum perenne]
MEAPDFHKSNCNRKLIGARYYVTSSPRDSIGHGTHTASTAAGSLVDNASYYGLARGTARGGAPSARIAVYNACSEDGCSGSVILKAIDDAIEDGVDLISISIGISSALQSDYLSDPIAIGGFHAQERGVTVVWSAGNDGPRPHTVVNSAPWIFTAAASNIDRDFQSTLVLGNESRYINDMNVATTNLAMSYLLRWMKLSLNFCLFHIKTSNCYPGSLEKDKVAGKIVICLTNDTSITRRIRKLVVEDAGGIGMIQINQEETSVPFDAGTFPFVAVGSRYGTRILNYMNRDKNPKATILATVDVPGHRPAPSVARFSSRGPVSLTENLLKVQWMQPDVTAPGVSILAAVNPTNEPGTVPIGQNPSGYALRSGTSMACPHVAGAAALIKSLHPKWSPSMIRSALMTTATIYNNMGKRMTNTSTQTATPHEIGAGEINPTKALNPGLVFHTTTLDYLQFLCYYGYSNRMIRSLSPRTKFTCSSNSKNKQSLMSSINYPSISIARLARGATQTTVRTVTNVGPVNSTYFAIANADGGLKAEVVPRKLVFTHGVQKLSFRVVFSATEASLLGYSFGYVTWRDRSLHHSVRLVFAVNVE